MSTAEVIPMPVANAPRPIRLNVEGSVAAPVLYSDHIGSVGLNDGVATITLEASRFLLVQDGERADDRVVIAHLRVPLNALSILETACGMIKQMARDQARAASTITPPGA